MRIGHGYDVHAFGPGHQIRLGGVDIAYSQGLRAHSDGDVILHALCDAILGAAGLGDIGQHFPDSSAEFADIDSRLLLRRVMALIDAEQLRIGNADITVIAQAPKLAPYIPAMRNGIATELDVGLDRVNVKATTTEGLGYIGRREGIATHAVVLLTEKE